MFGLLRNEINRLVGILGLACVMVSSCSAQRLIGCDAVCYGKNLLRILYPQLSAEMEIHLASVFPLTEAGSLGNFDAHVRLPTPHSRLSFQGGAFHDPGDNEPAPLDVSFQFFGHRELRLLKFASFGAEVNGDRLDGLKKAVDEHPDWTDAQVVAAMKSAGAQYVPGDDKQLLKAIPIRRLERLLGKIHVDSVELELRNQPSLEEKLPSAELLWSVHFTTTDADLKKRHFFMHLEPFEGKIIAIERHDRWLF